MAQRDSRIISNKRFQGNYWHCIFDAPLIAKIAKPGQFINIKLSRNLEPFLRRPFSIHNISGNKVEILYEVLGPGTKILSAGKKGEYLDIIGPLGNGFTYSTKAKSSSQKIIIVAGGIGAAPLLYLSRKIKAEHKIVLIGARTKEEVLCEKEFKKSGCFVKIATDDGSDGFKGRVSGLLKLALKVLDSKSAVIYACGPKPMLKAVADIAGEKNIPAQVSMEEHMSCGIGACLGCVVKTKKGLERVCKEGPVFDAQYLIW
jgi:dihydroorotate dehydrogenase electron transfer subunit